LARGFASVSGKRPAKTLSNGCDYSFIGGRKLLFFCGEEKNMTYNFDTIIERRGTQSLKWDVAENELPMWVADMDFQTAPEITAAVRERAAHGVFGYNILPDEWYTAIQRWWRERHGFSVEKDWLLFSAGVVPTISSVVRKLTTPGENVLVQTPVYNIFFNSIRNNGRQVLESPLRYDGGEYRIDFEALERKLADPQTALMILCNPHNPIGKIWDRETLEKIGELCRKHHVLVLSDEIHCDLTDPGCDYVPFASVSECCAQNSITCVAPTKTFNLAGLQSSAVIVPNPVLRHKVWRGLNTDEVAEPNCFAAIAAAAAFSKGAPWLDALRAYLLDNKNAVREFVSRRIPQVDVVSSQATYLLWLDCGKVTHDSEELARYIREKTGLYLSAGSVYGGNGGQFLRLNAACPQERLLDGLNRLETGIVSYK